MEEEHRTYEQGLIQGQLSALEQMQARHGRVLEDHARRLTAQERITFGLLGAIMLLEVLPTISMLVE